MTLYRLHPVIRLPRSLPAVQTSMHSRFIAVARLLAKALDLRVERWVFSVLSNQRADRRGSRVFLTKTGGICRIR